MIKYLQRGAIVLLPALFLSGCEMVNPEEEQPGFVTIQKTYFQASAPNSVSHEITSGWVYAKGKLLGVYDFPVTIPVLGTGPTEITVYAGVIADGQRATRDMYPFYAPFRQTLTLVPGQSYSIAPEITYAEGVDLPVNEDFEISISDLTATNGYNLQRVQINQGDSLYFDRGGSKVGFVQAKIDTTNIIRLISTVDNIKLEGGAAAFLELDMRSSLPVAIGIQYVLNGATSGPVYQLTAFPSSTWKKYYVNLLDEVASVNNRDAQLRVLLQAEPDTTGRDYIAVDNVRLVHF